MRQESPHLVGQLTERHFTLFTGDEIPQSCNPSCEFVVSKYDGYRCTGGTLLYRDGNSWTQITARSNHAYCPGTSVEDCYPVTPRSVGCVAR